MNSKILVLYSAYNAEDYIHKSIYPFLNHPNCLVAATSRRFSRFPEERKDNTVSILNTYFDRYDNFIALDCSDEPVDREHEAKNELLTLATPHLKTVPDYIMIVDSDEFYSTKDIDYILDYIEEEKEFVTFKVPLKNYINDTEHYLEEPFCPPRVFRTSFKTDWTEPAGSFSLLQFYWDNDVCYFRTTDVEDGKIPVYKWDQFASCLIPYVWVDHYSWLDDERSKNKIEYQRKHFGHCGYKWEDGVKFDETYYRIIGAELPIIIEK